jgi:hypothetical protein
MSSSFLQFTAAPTTEPVPPIRDTKNETVVAGERLEILAGEIDDLARLIFVANGLSIIADTTRAMVAAFDKAKEIVLARRGFTQKFTPEEITKNAEAAARKKKVAEMQKKYAEADRLESIAVQVDRQTRSELVSFKPASLTTAVNSPAFWVEKAALVAKLNNERAKHGLNPLSVA